MIEFANADFARFACALDEGIVPSSSNAFELVFDDDLTVAVVLHPNQKRVLSELFVCDAARLTGPMRRAVVHALLAMNHVGLLGRRFVCGLDSRSFVTLVGEIGLEDLDAIKYANHLNYLLRQARRVRELVRNLSMQGAGFSFALQPAVGGAQ
ncbi:type III secretion system chaperone [Propionivibrio soli]|uniref:type III secretion system chaperone n=1 Tax=Propionivibrio soli TaxID=2976531 RepID=UPI0021E81B46|nr:type III secretion system chaperone [Propionivibrio soli]